MNLTTIINNIINHISRCSTLWVLGLFSQSTASHSADRPLAVDESPYLRWQATWHQHGMEIMLLLSAVLVIIMLLGLLVYHYRQLQQSEARFRHFFEKNSSVMLLIEPLTGKIVAANAAAAQYYGYPLTILTTFKISKINALSETQLAREREYALRQQRRYFLFQHRLANGELRDVEVYSTPIRSKGHTLLFSIVHDITQRKQAEAALRDSEKKYRTLLENTAEGFWLLDVDLRTLEVNDALCQMLGYQHHQLLGRTPFDFIDNHSQIILKEQANKREQQQHRKYEITLINKNRERLHTIFSATSLHNREGRLEGSFILVTDISQHKQTEKNLKLAANVFTHAREGIMITDVDSHILEINTAFSRITGYERHEVLGQNPRLLNSGRQSKAFYSQLWETLLGKGYWSGEIWNRHKSGKVYVELLTITAVRDTHGQTQYYVGLFSDITIQKHQQQQLERIAHYDALTNLPNRLLLADRLQQAMEHSQRRNQQLAVVYLDLDGFKAVNDNYGHDIGDQLLITLANRMQQALRTSDTIARLGGDEFVAVLTDLGDAKASGLILTRLLAAAAQPVHVKQHVLQVSASLGVTFYPQCVEADADQLLRQADQAMYQAKIAGKNCYRFFDLQQDRSLRAHYDGIERVRQALQQQELVVHYQPLVHMRDGTTIGVEALLRWQHPERGLLLPSAFLPMLQGQPLQLEIGDWLLHQVLTQLTAWQIKQGLSLTVSLNISVQQLQQTDFLPRLQAMLSCYPQITPNQLILEVLETNALEDLEEISVLMANCKAIGIRFALDDFGTGYCSLAYLKCLPATQLKIDQSFVRDMLDDPEDLAILEGILGLAAAFRRQVIAEGVETLAHGELLLQLGCEYAQGDSIAPAMPAAQLVAWLQHWQPPASWTAQKRISRDHLLLLFAIVEHRAWVKAVEAFVQGKAEYCPPLDSSQCRFGQWLNNEGQTRYGTQANFDNIINLHEQVHELATHLLDKTSKGDTAEQQMYLQQLQNTRDHLLAELKALL